MRPCSHSLGTKNNDFDFCLREDGLHRRKEEQQSKLAARKYAWIIQKFRFQAKFKDFIIQNIVRSCDVNFPISLEGLSYSHDAFSSMINIQCEIIPLHNPYVSPTILSINVVCWKHAICLEFIEKVRPTDMLDKYCSAREDLTIDHVLPVSRGAKWMWENLAPKEFDILAIQLANAAIWILRSKKGMKEEWHRYLAKPSSEPY